jgi:hypothetical protein
MKRSLSFATISVAFALALSYGCSSSSDYEGGGRRLFPPGGGDGTVLETPDTATPDDTNTPIDTATPDTNPPPIDSGPERG